MLTINEDGNVSFVNDADTYDLSLSEDYQRFLIWLTSPDETQEIEESIFDSDTSAPATDQAKLERYSDFLKSFLSKRSSVFAEATAAGRTNEKRVSEMQSLINELKEEETA